MARILSVTFETESRAEPGRFSVPKQAADFLGLGPDDLVDVVVMCEGLRVEVTTRLGSGLEVRPRAGDEGTALLARIPAKTPIEVTVWRSEVSVDPSIPAPRAAPWTAGRFDEEIARRAGPELARRGRVVREWAEARGLRLWWGRGRQHGGWIPVFDAHSGRGYSLFEMWTDGRLEMSFRTLKTNPAMRAEPPRQELHRRLCAVPGVSLPPGAVERFPSFMLSGVRDDQAVQQLLDVFDWLLDELRKGDP